MRVQLVHEWLAERAGSELVVEAFLDAWPGSPLHALVHEPQHYPAHSPIVRADIRTSCFQQRGWVRRRFRHFLPFMPWAVEQYDVRAAEVVVSSHHAVANGVLTGAKQLHISYVHSPMRYAWERYHDYLEEFGLARGLKGLATRWCLHYLRQWDRLAADRVDLFVANSTTVARRIEATWRRRAVVVPPPVSVERFRADRPREDFYCTVSRMVPYKRIDLLVDACQRSGRKLVVIGDGPERARCQQLAGEHVTFLGHLEDAAVADHLERCRGFLFAAEEDFGIVPVEAMAAGAPVIAYGHGGIRDSVLPGETGVFFDQQTPEAVIAALAAFESRDCSSAACRHRAETFSRDAFIARMRTLVAEAWDRFRSDGPLTMEAELTR
jgi:glycosyltransferase involved in cell wall biosynthesis